MLPGMCDRCAIGKWPEIGSVLSLNGAQVASRVATGQDRKRNKTFLRARAPAPARARARARDPTEYLLGTVARSAP